MAGKQLDNHRPPERTSVEGWQPADISPDSEAGYHLQLAGKINPIFSTGFVEAYSADIPGMMYCYALLHRPSGTIYFSLAEE